VIQTQTVTTETKPVIQTQTVTTETTKPSSTSITQTSSIQNESCIVIPGKVTCKEGQTTTTTSIFVPVDRDVSKEDSIKITTGQIKNIGDYTVTVNEKKEIMVEKPKITEVVTKETNQKVPISNVIETKTKVETVPDITTSVKEKILEKKEQAIHDARKKIEEEIIKKNSEEIVKITKDEIKDKVKYIIEKERQIIMDRREQLEKLKEDKNKCTSQDCKDQVMIQTETVKDEIVKDQIEIDKSKVIIDNLDRMKCKACCCFDHKKVLESVISKIKEMIPEGLEYTINVQTITGKDKIKEYLTKHHKKYLKLFKKGGFKKYFNRFSSFRVAYFKSERNAQKYKKAFKFCRSHETVQYYQLRSRKVRCEKIIKKYLVYRKLSKAFKMKCARNHISIRRGGFNSERRFQNRVVRSPVYRRSYSRSYSNQSPRGRRLQSLPTNQADINLVDTFKSHLASFKVEDRALLAKCLA